MQEFFVIIVSIFATIFIFRYVKKNLNEGEGPAKCANCQLLRNIDRPGKTDMKN